MNRPVLVALAALVLAMLAGCDGSDDTPPRLYDSAQATFADMAPGDAGAFCGAVIFGDDDAELIDGARDVWPDETADLTDDQIDAELIGACLKVMDR